MLIDSQPDLSVVAEAGDGAEGVRTLTATEADVVLMDVRMPVMDGIAATEKLTAEQPHLKIIVLTTFDLDEYVMAAIRAGASGFLLKDAPPEELLTAIRTVYSGDAVIAPSATKRLLSHLATAPEPTLSGVGSGFETPSGSSTDGIRHLREDTANLLREIVAGMNLNNFLVRPHRRTVEDPQTSWP